MVHAILNADFDDGFVAYINGVEVARDNVGEYGIVPTYTDLASSNREATMYKGDDPISFFLHALALKEILTNGTNVFAIQIHNSSSTSSDLSARFYLSFGVTSSNTLYSTPPSWFEAPTISFFSSNLPIIEINTNEQAILSEERIIASMGIINNGAGQTNFFGGAYNEYDGRISLKYRGQSSLEFEKKSMSFETQYSFGDNQNISLLGMPKENDWVLYAPYSDKSLIRNALTYKLHERMGNYAPRFVFCELVINNEYRGIYMLTEKIKRDDNRVDIAKIEYTDTVNDALTGGYILNIDKGAELGVNAWQASFTPPYYGWDALKYQHHYPKLENINAIQKQYIEDYIHDFDQSLKSTSFSDNVNGYRPYIDLKSFQDFMLITELSKDVDSYTYSNYLYKRKDSRGGEIVMGPVWDFNAGYGNVDYSSRGAEKTSEWLYDEKGEKIYWFDRMMDDSVFVNDLNCRWSDLRDNVLNTTEVVSLIDSLSDLLEEAQQRNFYKWDILGEYVWPNNYVGATYDDEVEFLKTWVTERMDWIDDSIPGTCTPANTNSIENIYASNLEIFPNPNTGSFRIRFKNLNGGDVNIEVFDISGKLMFNINKQNRVIGYDVTNIQTSNLATGIYQVLITSNESIIGTQKLIIR